jgi:L-amino acid N-acyltransferase YncA
MSKIRLATEADLPSIIAIYNAMIAGRRVTADLNPVSVASRRAWFEAHEPDRHPLWVWEEPDGVAAWLSYQAFYGRPAYDATAEVSIYVASRHQRRGLGRVLLAEAITHAPKLGLRTLLGFIVGHNEPSLRLFESHGFARWGHLPRVAELDGIERDLIIVGRRTEQP